MNEFSSQICTSKEQSGRLWRLGLKPETADMCWFDDMQKPFCSPYKCFVDRAQDMKWVIFPAWSLHRLIELCGAEHLSVSFHKKGKVRIRVNHIHPTHDGRSNYNHYDSLIDCIEWIIKEGYFNKEYLSNEKG